MTLPSAPLSLAAAACVLALAATPNLAQAPAVPPALVPVQFDEAVQKAANALMSKVPEPAAGDREMVIDPLVDGYTGAQNVATTIMGNSIEDLVKKRYGRFKVVPFTSEAVSKQPLLLVGTFRPINTKNEPTGPKDAYHICLAMLDLKSGTVVSKGVARAVPEGIDVTPVSFFRDSPVWTPDPATAGYIKTCQATKVGDPIDQGYADQILATVLINDGIDAYNNRRYQDALGLYQSALKMASGQQLRAYNGVYLANWKLNRRKAAAEAFGAMVDYGLANNRLATKFLFRPGSTQFVSDHELSTAYPVWLKEIAAGAAKRDACLEIVGHSSPTGPAAINDRLSLLRAEFVKDRIAWEAPAMSNRMIADGKGSREPIVGTGRDDESDALDRRVEFKPLRCGETAQPAAPANDTRTRPTQVAVATPAAPPATPAPPPPAPPVVERLQPIQDCAVCPVLVRIPAGSFLMGQAKGDPSTQPQRTVSVRAFAIGQYPVTVGEWKACVAAGGCNFTPRMVDAVDLTPVHNVSWDDAELYISWLSRSVGKTYRLPTEAEWEYAARANATTRYWWGDDAGTMQANCSDCGGNQNPKTPMPVGSFRPNAFGVHDVHGGVAQWVADCWFPNYQGAPTMAVARDQKNCQKRVLRGGSFRNDREAIASAARNNYDASVRYLTHGFRIARDLN
jgi:formylglycine-generating enzyme required for sulfatase activity/outer membrane protein OmpA-like peptidoglycan-associated protein